MSQNLKTATARGGLLLAPEGSVAPVFVNTAVAAKLLNVSASFLNKARLSGGGPPFAKFGFHVRYNTQALMVWAAEQTRRSTSDPGQAA